MSPYQTLRIAAQDVQTGDRSCAERYELLRPVLDQYDRPITVLDLGANLGYFSLRIAEDYSAVVVAIDSDPALRSALKANDRDDVLGIVRTLSIQDLLDIGACEHFDVVLAMNILHHFPDPTAALAAVRTLGEHILIETPSNEDTQSCGSPFKKASLLETIQALPYARLIGWTDSHTTSAVKRPMYHLRENKPRIAAPYFRSHEMGMPEMRAHSVISTTCSKTLVIPSKGELRPWLPGINLWTWIKLGGGYPDTTTVGEAVEAAYFHGYEEVGSQHGDVRPWNFVLHGPRSATLIDWKDERTLPTDDAEWLDITMKLIESPDAIKEPKAA